jgi:membrane associated rhomboid family serine protease
MFIPLRTDRAPRRRPMVTEALLLINLAVYLVGAAGAYLGLLENPAAIAHWGRFDPVAARWWQLLTYQFIHDPEDLWHIAANMLFLWVFGCAVEGRLGRLGFAGFYLLGGVVAALAHAMKDPHPVIGASGSIAGVSGAFLALFPRSRVLILALIWGLVSIPSPWFIGFYFLVDFLSFALPGRGDRVAYMAHLAGYLYGFGTAFMLLATGILKREEFDVFFLFKQARRRSAFRRASRRGPAGLFDAAQADTERRLVRDAARQTPEPADPALTSRHAELRAEVNRLAAAGELRGAARRYQELLARSPGGPESVLPEPRQLDVATQLYADGADADAATAYERLLAAYPSSPKADEVRLILGLIYARKLGRPQRARELIEQARGRLRDDSQTALADRLLAELGS